MCVSSPLGKERRISGAVARVAQMRSTNPSSSVIVDQLTRALGEAAIRIWSNLPQEVQDDLFKEAVASQGDSIRSQQLAVFLHGKHSRTSDPLGDLLRNEGAGQPWGLARL